MKDNFTVIAVVLDRSGSMQSAKEGTIQGFNEFLKGQKALQGEAKLTLMQFDNEFLVPYDLAPINDVPPLNADTFMPRGTTALYDAMGKTIDNLGRQLAAMPESERPSKVVVVTITDGFENASSQYTQKKVFDLISHQKSVYGWEFMFLGANQDALAAGDALGIGAASSLNYNSTNIGANVAFKSVTRSIGAYRVGATANAVFNQQDRDENDTDTATVVPTTVVPTTVTKSVP